MEELILQPLIHQFMQALAKDVRFPQPLRVGLKIPQQTLNQILALLLGAHNGADLGVDDGFHHMDGGCAGFQPDTVPPALPYDLRFLQRELLNAGHHDAVAGGFHLFQCTADLLVLPFCPGKLNDAGHQARFVTNFQPRLLTENAVEHLRLQQNGHPHHAVGKVHAAQGGLLHRISGQRPGTVLGRNILHPADLL